MAESKEDNFLNELKETCQRKPELYNLNEIQNVYKDLFIELTNSLNVNDDEINKQFCHHGDFSDCNSDIFEKDKLLFGNIIHWIQDVYIFGTILNVDAEINKIRDMKLTDMLATEDKNDKKIHKALKNEIKTTEDTLKKKNIASQMKNMSIMARKKKQIVNDFKKTDKRMLFRYKSSVEIQIKLYSEYKSIEDIGHLLNMIDRVIYFRKFDTFCKNKTFTTKEIRENQEKYNFNLKIIHEHSEFITLLGTFRNLLINHSRCHRKNMKNEFENMINQSQFDS